MQPRLCQPDGCALFYIVQKLIGQAITILCNDGDWVPVKEITQESVESATSTGGASVWGIKTIESARRLERACQLIVKKSGNRNVFQRIGPFRPKRTEREETIIRKMEDIIQDSQIPVLDARGG